MLSLKNLDLLNESSSAQQTYRKLHIANRICQVLLVVLVLLGIWNVIAVASLIRGVNAPDLADVGSILTHLSTRLIWIVSAIALAFYLFKEWKWGERGFPMVFFLAGLLFLVLVPTMSAEIEPAEEPVTLDLTYAICESGALADSTLVDADKCEISRPAEGDVFLGDSNPIDGDVNWIDPNRFESGYTRWNLDTRGRFTVYYMVKQPSMEHCETAQIATSVNPDERRDHDCFERDGAAWLVMPFETSAVDSGYLTIYQESAP